jgi:hypothetical protein
LRHPALRGDPGLEGCVLETLREHYRDPFWWGGAGLECLWDYLRVSAEVGAAHLGRRREHAPLPAETSKRQAPRGKPEMDAAMAARAAAFFSRQPECLGYWLEAYCEAQAIEPAALASELGCTLALLHRLALCLRPHEDRLREEAAVLGARYGVDAGRLEAVFLHARALPREEEGTRRRGSRRAFGS